MGSQRVVYIRVMQYHGNDIFSFKVHANYETALKDAREIAQSAGDLFEVTELFQATDNYVASVYCAAGVAHVIKSTLEE